VEAVALLSSEHLFLNAFLKSTIMSHIVTSDYLSAPLESAPAEAHAGALASSSRRTITLSNGESFHFEATEQDAAEGAGTVFYVVQDGKRTPIVATLDGSNTIKLSLNGYTYTLDVHSERDQYFQRLLRDTATASSGMMKVAAPMPGLLKAVVVENGQHVKKGERLFILEAMKMENDIKSPTDGVIAGLSAAAGTPVEKGFLLCTIEAAAK
jgi:biotin carboxyl carrier protein